MKKDSSARDDEKEIAKRRDEALKRALGMPHKPHKDSPKKPSKEKDQ